MIQVTRLENSVLFEFSENQHYLYNGSIEVPYNTLSIIQDGSDMITLRKSASNDIFLSARYNDFGEGSVDAAVDMLADSLFNAEGGGGGISSGDVQTMIDTSLDDYYDKDEVDTAFETVNASLSGKADTSAVTAVANDVSTLSGQVATKVDESDFSTHTANTDIHVSSQEKNDWNNKLDADDLAPYWTSAETQNAIDAATSGIPSSQVIEQLRTDVNSLSGDVADINDAIAELDDKEQVIVSALTQLRDDMDEKEEVVASALNDLQENKADTSAVTAVQQSLSGKQDTLVSGTNIKTINNESILGSGNITISGGGGQSLVYYTEDTSNESATIMVQNDDGLGNRSENRVFVDGGDIIIERYNETDDGEGNTGTTDTQVDINSLGLSIITYSDDGIDTPQTELKVQPMGAYINSEPIATEPYVDAAISGKVDTSAITTAVTSGSTDAEIPTAKAVYDAIPTGGGATYSAGTNISIDTANTINCTLNARNGTGANSLIIGNEYCEVYGGYSLGIGERVTVGTGKSNSLAVGMQSNVYGSNAQAMGRNVVSSNDFEHSTGRYNNSTRTNTTFGNSGNTLLSVGNGHYQNGEHKHNALDIRQNGDLYFADTDNTTYQNFYEKPMVRLQDMYGALGGLKLVQCTQAEYDAMVSGGTVDSSTIYFISNVVS